MEFHEDDFNGSGMRDQQSCGNFVFFLSDFVTMLMMRLSCDNFAGLSFLNHYSRLPETSFVYSLGYI